MTEDLFTFPIVMVDGENEEKKEEEKQRFGTLPGQTEEPYEYDIIYGEAAYPYFDFLGFEDRWLPTQRSLQRALKQKFDACIVRFEGAGQFLVPMSKEKFKQKIDEFATERKKTVKEEPKNTILITINPDVLTSLIKKEDEK